MVPITSHMDIEMWTERARQRVRMVRIAWALTIAAYGIASLAMMTGDRIMWLATLALAGGVFMTVAILPDVTHAEIGIEDPRLLLAREERSPDLSQNDLGRAA